VSVSTTFLFHRKAVCKWRPESPFFLFLWLATRIAFLAVLALCGGVAGFAQAQSDGVQELVRRFEARYRGARSLQVHFLERYSEQGRTVRLDAGVAYFQRPGKMRWEYESPEAKVFVSDGRTIWFYVPADRTAMRSTVKKDADERTPFALLTGNPRLARLCASVVLGQSVEPLTPGNQVLLCRPRGAKAAPQGGGEILLEIDPETGNLDRVRVDQGGGAALEFQFTKWERNRDDKEGRFHFEPPLGVAIVNAPVATNDAPPRQPR